MEQIRLDLIPGKNPPTCHASQYDAGRTIRLNLVEGGSDYTIPAGTTAEIHIRKPDNNIISAAVTATQGNKYIDIVTAEQWTACAGTNLCEIVLTNGGNVIGTINFILEVEMDPIDGGSASESVIYNIQALVDTAVALHTFLIHITETTMTESAADILGAISSNKILQVVYKPDANSLTTHILPLTSDSGARPDGIRALSFASLRGSKLYAADIVLDTVHSTVSTLNMTNGKDLGDFPIHIHNTTITETAGEVLDAMADGLKPYVIWTNDSQSNYTFTYGLSAVWNPDATTETLIFSCPITGAVRTIHVFINPTTRTYSSSIQIVDYDIPQINDATTSASSVWSSDKIASELSGKAEIDDTATDTDTTWSSSRIASFLPVDTAQGAVANFSDGADNVPVDSLVADIDYKDTTGFNVVNVTRAGKNLFDKNNANILYAILSTDGTISASQNGRTIYIPCEPNTTYTISKKAGQRFSVAYTATASAPTHGDSISGKIENFTGTSITITTGATATYLCSYIYNANLDTDSLDTIINSIQIELGSTATTYEPYTATTSTINLGGTIYGGSVNITDGTVTSTKAQDGTDLPDPVVTTITPTAINTLKGTNNIWADTGDVSVEYRADVGLYIDKKIE